ncbi:MAG TPA: glycosyltransferase [Chloroflexi bacterium]|nr:glycosyltransferase [Chloroflexota bacterium]
MTTLSVVIPAYNEEGGIRSIMERVLAVRDALREVGVDDLELLVVDDGSSDRTAELVRAQPGATLVQHARNGGYGAALKTGFAAAKGEWVGFLDADGTYPPEYFPALIKAAKEQNADLVIGSRMAGAESQMPLTRRIGNLIFARLVNIISASQITDSASGMRVFKKSILGQLYPLPDGLNLTPVMSTRALHEHLKMIEVPIPYSERIGRSKLSVVRDGMRFGSSIVWTALNYNPARPFGLIGMVSFGIAALIGLALVWYRLQGVQTVTPLGAFALFSALVLSVGGVMLIALGFSFNYFVALFHKTPVRQGLWGKPLFNVRWEQHFGWVGLVIALFGLIVGAGSLIATLLGATLIQLWIYYLISAVFSLMGLQLIVAWVQMQTLDALRIREDLAASDLRGKETTLQSDVTHTEIRTDRLQPQS